jgi:hypothetical protein
MPNIVALMQSIRLLLQATIVAAKWNAPRGRGQPVVHKRCRCGAGDLVFYLGGALFCGRDAPHRADAGVRAFAASDPRRISAILKRISDLEHHVLHVPVVEKIRGLSVRQLSSMVEDWPRLL